MPIFRLVPFFGVCALLRSRYTGLSVGSGLKELRPYEFLSFLRQRWLWTRYLEFEGFLLSRVALPLCLSSHDKQRPFSPAASPSPLYLLLPSSVFFVVFYSWLFCLSVSSGIGSLLLLVVLEDFTPPSLKKRCPTFSETVFCRNLPRVLSLCPSNHVRKQGQLNRVWFPASFPDYSHFPPPKILPPFFFSPKTPRVFTPQLLLNKIQLPDPPTHPVFLFSFFGFASDWF